MLNSTQEQVKSVSQLTSEIKNILEATYRFVLVSGEISNLKTPFSGHHYLTLKDSNAQMRAVMFKGQQRYLAEPLRDGQQVICRGRISVYEPRGEYQLIIDSVVQSGAGALQQKFEALKRKLSNEGLFDRDFKKDIPQYPENIIIVSSPTGAAVQDFLKICRQRRTLTHIQVFPVPVQGATASTKIADAIAQINKSIKCDIIVLCRGGGSIEDLWSFNEEVVARAIHHSSIPIVTGVGHEIDTTIADLCADLRAPTPTGAAEIIIPDTNRLNKEIRSFETRLHRFISQRISYYEQVVSQQTRHLANYQNIIEKLTLRLDFIIAQFQQVIVRSFYKKQEKINSLVSRIEHQAPLNRIELQKQKVKYLEQRIIGYMSSILNNRDEQLARAAALLNSVSPLSTLSRGYSIVQKKDPQTDQLHTVTDSAQVECGDVLKILLNKGKLSCEVISSEIE